MVHLTGSLRLLLTEPVNDRHDDDRAQRDEERYNRKPQRLS